MADTASLTDLASAELSTATAAISGGDEVASRFARDIQRLVDGVNGETRRAIATANRLYDDDIMNPQGKARQLAELPVNLLGTTSEALKQAEDTLGVIEVLHVGAILRHDGRDDANRREELNNYVANLKQRDAVATMVKLAANPRYSTYLSGPMGQSLAARFGFEPEILQKTALQALAVDGTEDQIARSKALSAITGMRRVIGLAKGGRDQAVQVIQRRPKPEPSTALMS